MWFASMVSTVSCADGRSTLNEKSSTTFRCQLNVSWPMNRGIWKVCTLLCNPFMPDMPRASWNECTMRPSSYTTVLKASWMLSKTSLLTSRVSRFGWILKSKTCHIRCNLAPIWRRTTSMRCPKKDYQLCALANRFLTGEEPEIFSAKRLGPVCPMSTVGWRITHVFGDNSTQAVCRWEPGMVNWLCLSDKLLG